MEDLLQKQIHDSFKLALPEGLKELMSDISREVLRAQPTNIYDFIANYLSVLLISREHLAIAGHLCDSVCATSCCQELEDELRYLDLEEEKAGRVKEFILEYFNGGNTCKKGFAFNLLNEISVNEEQMDAIKQAVNKAFKRSLINNTVYYQAAYRAYGVTRYDYAKEEHSELKMNKPPKRNLRFETNLQNEGTDSEVNKKLSTVSSSTLAGSYIILPKHVPYSVHDNFLQIVAETTERENVLINYIDEYEENNKESIEEIVEYEAKNTKVNEEYKVEQDFEVDDQEIADIDSESSINEELVCDFSDDDNKEF
ncbi:unnamed protein product [Diatraea saccharalis]|uniref:RIIa domain-containing protein n=1 Tax=Diatraea saccharalis TaxID=40085 RepID=A0A9N9R6E4_9NEOP|nr:unnamed protein product [Diatraea saccharalis]